MSDAFFRLFDPLTHAATRGQKPLNGFLALHQAQDEIDIELIVVKKIIKSQEGVPDLEHRRDRCKDPFHEQGRPRLRRVQIVFLKGDAVFHKGLLQDTAVGTDGQRVHVHSLLRF